MSTVPVGKVLVKGSIWTTLGEALSGIGMLAAGILAARLLSPHDFGLMGAAMLALTIVDQFSQTGFHSALVQRENDVESYLDVAFTWHLIRGAFLCALLAAAAPWLGRFYAEPRLVPVLLAVALHPLISATANIGQVYFHRKLDFRALALVKLGQTALRIAVFVPAILIFKSVWALVLSVLASALSNVVISYLSHPYRPRLRWDAARLRELIRFGKWLTGFAAISFFITFGDNLFVSKYFGVAMLGVYQLAFEVANYPTTHGTHVLGRIAFPLYARLQREPVELLQAFERVMRSAFLLSATVSALLFVVAHDLVAHVLGAKWLPAVPLIRILVVAGLFRSLTATGGPLFHALGRADLDFKMNLPRFLVTMIGLWPAAHWLGIEGVCYVVFGAVLTTLPAWFLGLRRLVGLTPGAIVRENLLAIFSGALLVGSHFLVRPRLGSGPWESLVGLLASLGVWLGAMWALGRFTRHDFFAELRRLRDGLRAR
jgi:O-antigen/teichoic acid export membrane protein